MITVVEIMEAVIGVNQIDYKVNKKIEGTDQKLREYYCEEKIESEEF